MKPTLLSFLASIATLIPVSAQAQSALDRPGSDRKPGQSGLGSGASLRPSGFDDSPQLIPDRSEQEQEIEYGRAIRGREYRIWTDRQNRQIRARVLRLLDEDHIVLQTAQVVNGQSQFTVPIAQFSERDIQHLLSEFPQHLDRPPYQPPSPPESTPPSRPEPPSDPEPENTDPESTNSQSDQDTPSSTDTSIPSDTDEPSEETDTSEEDNQ